MLIILNWLIIELEGFEKASNITLFDIYENVFNEFIINRSQDQHTVDISDLFEGFYIFEIKIEANKSVFEKFLVL
jgi:hypothetical protein